ncbi:MAG: hypothetical protein NVS3B3_20030 [Aquirhabdus sp.]
MSNECISRYQVTNFKERIQKQYSEVLTRAGLPTTGKFVSKWDIAQHEQSLTD